MSRASRREEFVVWLWRRLPFSGSVKAAVAWLANLRFAVGVAAIIADADGKILVVKHTYRAPTRQWGLPGGWARGRERLEQALARELREETGLEIAVGRVVSVQSGYTLPRLTVYYRARITGGVFRPSAEVSAREYRAPSDLGDVLGAERQAVSEAAAL